MSDRPMPEPGPRPRAGGPAARKGRAAAPEQPLGPERLRAVLEALAFATEEPLTLEDLSDLFPGMDQALLQEALDGLERACQAEDRGLRMIRVAGGHRLVTKSELGEWVRALFRSRNRRRLTTQALETLAIVAYRQPITTPEIQAIRGTDPTAVLEGLLEKKLVRILGRKKVVGKPVLYGTTREFLAHFGLNTLDELPDLQEFGGFAAPVGAGPERAAVAPEPFEDDGGDNGADDDPSDDDDDETEREDDGDDS